VKESAGTLLYRWRGDRLEVLIIKPGGFAAKYGWSIPKGLVEPGEDAETAARRETREEAGIEPGPLELLGRIEYTKSKKRIACFFGPALEGADPRKTRDLEVAEVRFVEKDEARRLLHRDQQAFIDMLEARLTRATGPA
jgi:predicted NUDIX family NTP pyrophosphohydrolase